MKHTLSLITALLLASLASVYASEFHVAPNGKDAAPGTKDQPFATAERARDAVRQLKGAGKYPAEGVTIWLRGGVYQRSGAFELDAQDSGNGKRDRSKSISIPCSCCLYSAISPQNLSVLDLSRFPILPLFRYFSPKSASIGPVPFSDPRPAVRTPLTRSISRTRQSVMMSCNTCVD